MVDIAMASEGAVSYESLVDLPFSTIHRVAARVAYHQRERARMMRQARRGK